MISPIGALLGAAVTLFASTPAASPTLTLKQATEASLSAETANFSQEYLQASSYSSDLPTIQLSNPDIEIDTNNELEEAQNPSIPEPTSKPSEKQVVPFVHPHPLDPEILFNLVNAHRTSLNLPEYQKDARLCELVNSRLPELAQEIFGSIPLHQGLRDRNLEYRVTENLIHMATEEQAFNWWLNSSIHRRSIESTLYTHSCNACIGNSCAQVFSNFSPVK